jgi:protein-S-isoprenylcysteine O-methyltransferase Ste14
MPNDVMLDVPESRKALPRPGRRLFAPPSRQGLMICAVSLMPAYLFALLAWIRVVAILDLWWFEVPSDAASAARYWMSIVYHALTATFLCLVAWLFLVRRPSVETGRARSRLADVVAVSGSGIVMLLATAPNTVENLLVIATAEALLTIGLIVMVVGLLCLGRSFGVMPRARGLVQRGLYRWIRHPIYLGEFLAFGGMMLPAFSVWTVGIYVIFVMLQLYRMVSEEQTLMAAYPEYDDYRTTTARLLPGVY